MKSMNLFLAVFWLMMGAGLVLWHWLYPEVRQARLPNSDVSLGWLAILMGLYNLARWYGIRAYLHRQGILEEQRRHREELERSDRRPDVEPDPNFDFSSPPSPPEEEAPPR